MKNNTVKFGVIAGLITATFTVIGAILMANGTNDIGYKSSEILGFTGIFLTINMIVIAMIKERQDAGGFISYKDSFMVGLKISVIASLFYVAAWMVMTSIYPQIIDTMLSMMEKNLKASDLSPEDLKDQLDQMAKWKTYYANPLLKAAMTFTEIFPIGLLISLITAGFIQKKPTTPTTEVLD